MLNARYGRILQALNDKQSEDGIALSFEQYNMKLKENYYLLALYCLQQMRPKNKWISNSLWGHIRNMEDDSTVKDYIYTQAEDTYFNLIYTSVWEEKTVALSKTTRREKNPAYKGEVMAINIRTHESFILVGEEEQRTMGFNPCNISDCVHDKKFIHKGHIFVRIIE